MINLILAIKFIHLLAAAAMFGTWLGIAGFMLLAYRSGNPSVVALIAQFAVRLELFVVAAALALQPISGFPLAWAIGLTPLNEFWIDASLVLYAAVVAAWLVSLRIEIRLRNMARQAPVTPRETALVPLGMNYLFCALAGTLWYGQFFFYTIGESQMGQYKFSSWAIHMASIILFSTLLGIAFSEWRGSSRKAMTLLTFGLVVLVSSTIIIGWGNYLAVAK